jgi:hypothetical protein
MVLQCEDWVQQEDEFPESVSGLWLTETLLAPHGRKLSGMQLGAWDAIIPADDKGTCDCVELLLGTQARAVVLSETAMAVVTTTITNPDINSEVV